MARMLVLTTTYPLGPDDPQPRFVEYLSKGLSKDNKVWVLAPSIKGRPQSCHSDFPIVKRYRYFFACGETLCGGDGVLENLKNNRLRLLLLPFFMVAQFMAAVRLVRKHNIDVIHAHWIIPQGLIAVLLSLLSRRRLKVLVTAHGADLFALQGTVLARLKRFVMQKADSVTVVSEAMKQRCISCHGIDSTRISVAPMGVDLNTTFVPKGVKNKRRLVFVGRLAEKKGIDTLLKAVSILQPKQEFVVDIIGGGSKLDYYKSQADRYRVLDRVLFHGAIENASIGSFLQHASIAVFPFRVTTDGDQEGLGLTMVEAMGCECIVIASDLPAVRDVVKDGVTGFLVEAESAELLAEQIDRVLSDQDKLDSLRINARQHVLRSFDWSIVAARYNGILKGFYRLD
ncbi:MAG: glycosyltransferase family 4 protein [Oleiphilus sp.]|nr:MAG: glycosyltransferase family 4 protein [Oleiphilus sp.]